LEKRIRRINQFNLSHIAIKIEAENLRKYIITNLIKNYKSVILIGDSNVKFICNFQYHLLSEDDKCNSSDNVLNMLIAEKITHN